MSTQFDILSEIRCELGEGPVWDEKRAELIWFDINRHVMFISSAEHQTLQAISCGEPASAAFLTDTQDMLIATASGLRRYDRDAEQFSAYLDIEADNPATRSNDSRTAPGNGLWFGTMGRGLEAEAGCIYHVRHKTLTPLYEKTSIPNATCFSPDGQTGYFADTPKQAIFKVSLDPETGLPLSAPEIFVDLAPEGLNPDGAVIDSEGRLWNAQWGAGRVACYDTDGAFVTAIHLPAQQLTCPAFGGDGLKTLYVTSAFEGLSPDERRRNPEAGAVFAIEMEVAGCPERRLTSL